MVLILFIYLFILVLILILIIIIIIIFFLNAFAGYYSNQLSIVTYRLRPSVLTQPILV